MKIAFRNFLQTLRRYKIASLLNVAGLTLSFAAFYIILVQVWWELGYNRLLADVKQVYLIEQTDDDQPGKWKPSAGRQIAERTIASRPDVVTGGCIFNGYRACSLRKFADDDADKFWMSARSISKPLLDVFSFRAVSGDVYALKHSETVIISSKAAGRLQVGVGDVLWGGLDRSDSADMLKVAAVFEDFPANSLLGDCEAFFDLGDAGLDNSSDWNYNYFVKLHPGADLKAFDLQWMQNFREMGYKGVHQDSVRLSPVSKLYFEQDSNHVPGAKGSAATTYTLLGIAVLIIVLAFINFVNFFFALVPVRIRAVNTFKIFGAPTSSLRFGFVFEAFGLVLISLLLAWYVVGFLHGTEFANYVNVPFALSRNLPVVGVIVAVAGAMALAASLYPAYYITSFSPAIVVKGSFAGSFAGRRLRLVLLGIQFFISLSLIVATVFIDRQYRFMMDHDMGFDRRNLLSAVCTGEVDRNYDVLREKLLSNPRIKDVTGMYQYFVSDRQMYWPCKIGDRNVNIPYYYVQWNFLRVMGIPITEGRDFSESDLARGGMFIFNEKARRELGVVAGQTVNYRNDPVVGFCADFNFRPLQYGIEPFAFYIKPAESYWPLPQVVYVRMMPGTDVGQAADFIRRCMSEVDSGLKEVEGMIPVRMFDEELEDQYGREHKLTMIVGLFALLAVVIALMGLFGLVLFEIQHRRQEIGIRRVMGASAGTILGMFNKRYIRLVALCFVISIPVSVGATWRWLSAFAYRTPLSWWVFALAFTAVVAVTVLIITVCAWRIANENPVKSVKTE